MKDDLGNPAKGSLSFLGAGSSSIASAISFSVLDFAFSSFFSSFFSFFPSFLGASFFSALPLRRKKKEEEEEEEEEEELGEKKMKRK